MFHTVYDSFEEFPDGRDYIGKHSSEDPYDPYLGSFADKSFDPTCKIVLGYSKTAEGSVWLEIQWQRVLGVKDDPAFANQVYQTSTGFDCTGVPHSEETKQKISVAHLGEGNPMFGKTGEKSPHFGKKRTKEAKQKMSVSQMGEKNSQFGKPCTNERREKTSVAQMGEKNHSHGKNWYVNSSGETCRSKEHPGPGWQLGRVFNG